MTATKKYLLQPGVKAGVDIFGHLVGGKEYVGCCEGDATPSDVRCHRMFPEAQSLTRQHS